MNGSEDAGVRSRTRALAYNAVYATARIQTNRPMSKEKKEKRLNSLCHRSFCETFDRCALLYTTALSAVLFVDPSRLTMLCPKSSVHSRLAMSPHICNTSAIRLTTNTSFLLSRKTKNDAMGAYPPAPDLVRVSSPLSLQTNGSNIRHPVDAL